MMNAQHKDRGVQSEARVQSGVSAISESVKSAGAGGLPRWVEVPIVALTLIAASPFIVLAAMLIAVTSRGPAIFRQRRVGQHGRLFELYKLRTMTPSADGPQVTSTKDERITRVGHFLRQTKLD